MTGYQGSQTSKTNYNLQFGSKGQSDAFLKLPGRWIEISGVARERTANYLLYSTPQERYKVKLILFNLSDGET